MKKTMMFVAMFGVMALVLGLAGTGWADTYTVTLDGDAGWDQLLGHLNTAAGTAGAHTININGGLTLTRTPGTGITKELTWATTTADSLTIVGGVGGGVTTLDAQAVAGDASRVLYLKSSATVQNLSVTGGYTVTAGGGIRLEPGAHNSRLTNLDIYSNTTEGYGGGVFIDAGNNGTVIEYSVIRNNTVVTGGGGVLANGNKTLIANTILFGNTTTSTVTDEGGGGIRVGGGSEPVIFGSLFYGNTTASLGSAMLVRSNSQLLHVANTTFADNGDGTHGIYHDSGQSMVLRNSIVSKNGAGIRAKSGGSGNVNLRFSVVDDTLVGTNYLYVSPEYGDPKFLNRTGSDYRLTEDSNAVDIGDLLDPQVYHYFVEMTEADKVLAFGGTLGDYTGYTMYYVPVIGQVAPEYDKLYDVIVDLGGFTPSAQHYLDNYIYTTDLAGNPRVYGGRIDAGAYEWQPEPVQDPDVPIAEPAGLGLLGLALSGLRKRRS